MDKIPTSQRLQEGKFRSDQICKGIYVSIYIDHFNDKFFFQYFF